MKYLIDLFATGLYAGKIPLAPGTWGTAVGVLFYWAIRGLPDHAYVATTVVFILFAVWVSNLAQGIYKQRDPQKVVIDEIAGFLVTMAFHKPLISTVVCAFVLFRIFDIVKPWPARWAERHFSDGRGIVFDDVFAGVYANAALWFFELIVPTLGINW